MSLTLFLIITAVVSYLLGGLNGAIITSLSIFHKDIRKYGSGNAGLTNFARIFGTNGIYLVIVVDILKTFVAVSLGRLLLGILGYPVIGIIFSGFCCMLGHVFPVYYRFQGGKAALCGGVLLWMIDWRVGLVCWSVFLVIVVFTKYVSLGSICAGLCMPASVAVFNYQGLDVTLSLFCTLLLLLAHRENIVRLLRGRESKLSIGNSGGRQ